jgi:hypothetical protein
MVWDCDQAHSPIHRFTGRTGDLACDGADEVASLIEDAVGMPNNCLLTFKSPEDNPRQGQGDYP